MFLIDYKDRRPIYEQIVEKFEELILKGAIEPTSQLPSVRNLAIELSINPNTIQRAYQELERKELIYTVKGKGTFVTDSQHIVDMKKLEVIGKIKEMAIEAISFGIRKEEIIDSIHSIDKEVSK